MTAPSDRAQTGPALADSAIAALRRHHEDLAARVGEFTDDDVAR